MWAITAHLLTGLRHGRPGAALPAYSAILGVVNLSARPSRLHLSSIRPLPKPYTSPRWGFAVPAAQPHSAAPARLRGPVTASPTERNRAVRLVARTATPPHSAPPAGAAAFDVSHLRPRLPLAPVAEELPRGSPSVHLRRPEIGLPTAAEMSGGGSGSGDKVPSPPLLPPVTSVFEMPSV